MSDGLAGGKRRKIELGAGHSSVANAKPIQLDMAKNTTKLLANYYKIASKEQYRKLQAFASKKDPKRFAAYARDVIKIDVTQAEHKAAEMSEKVTKATGHVQEYLSSTASCSAPLPPSTIKTILRTFPQEVRNKIGSTVLVLLRDEQRVGEILNKQYKDDEKHMKGMSILLEVIMQWEKDIKQEEKRKRTEEEARQKRLVEKRAKAGSEKGWGTKLFGDVFSRFGIGSGGSGAGGSAGGSSSATEGGAPPSSAGTNVPLVMPSGRTVGPGFVAQAGILGRPPKPVITPRAAMDQKAKEDFLKKIQTMAKSKEKQVVQMRKNLKDMGVRNHGTVIATVVNSWKIEDLPSEVTFYAYAQEVDVLEAVFDELIKGTSRNSISFGEKSQAQNQTTHMKWGGVYTAYVGLCENPSTWGKQDFSWSFTSDDKHNCSLRSMLDCFLDEVRADDGAAEKMGAKTEDQLGWEGVLEGQAQQVRTAGIDILVNHPHPTWLIRALYRSFEGGESLQYDEAMLQSNLEDIVQTASGGGLLTLEAGCLFFFLSLRGKEKGSYLECIELGSMYFCGAVVESYGVSMNKAGEVGTSYVRIREKAFWRALGEEGEGKGLEQFVGVGDDPSQWTERVLYSVCQNDQKSQGSHFSRLSKGKASGAAGGSVGDAPVESGASGGLIVLSDSDSE